MINSEPTAVVANWISFDIGHGRHLHTHPELSTLRHDVGKIAMTLLGVACRSDGAAPLSVAINQQPLCDPDVNSLLDNLVGNYALIVSSPSGLAVYTDPGGMMNVFYCHEEVASTPSLLCAKGGLRVDSQRMAIWQRDEWLTGDQTPFEGVRVLMANHRLDLLSGVTSRFWPRERPAPGSVSETIAEGAAALVNSARSLVKRHTPLLSLTGGLDSRVMLAAMRQNNDICKAFTLSCVPARERNIIATILRVSKIAHEWVETTQSSPPELLALYDGMTLGLSQGSRRRVIDGCWRLRASLSVHLSGNLGAIAKGFYWPSGHAKHPTTRLLTRDFTRKDRVQHEGAERWISSVPTNMSPEAACNLMYLEQRGCRWMGIGEVASNLFYAPVTLFSNRRLFEALCSAPVSEQISGRLLRAWVREMWPELDTIEYASGTNRLRRRMPKRLKALLAPYLKGRL